MNVSNGRSDDGASAVEYGLLVVAVAAVIAFIVFILGQTVIGQYQGTCNNIATETGSGGC